MSVGAIFSSAYKTTQIVEIVALFARVKIIATVVRNDLLRESWFCERVMLRPSSTMTMQEVTHSTTVPCSLNITLSQNHDSLNKSFLTTVAMAL